MIIYDKYRIIKMGVPYNGDDNGDDNGDHIIILWFIFRNHTYIIICIYVYIHIIIIMMVI